KPTDCIRGLEIEKLLVVLHADDRHAHLLRTAMPFFPGGDDWTFSAHRSRHDRVRGVIRQRGGTMRSRTQHQHSSRSARVPYEVDAARSRSGPALLACAERGFAFAGRAAEKLLVAPPDGDDLAFSSPRQPAAVHRAGVKRPGPLTKLDWLAK